MLREGLAIGPVYHPEMGADFPERRLAMRAEDRREHVHRIVDGRWLRIRENRTPDGGRVLLSTDISEERRRAAELRLLALAVEQAGDPVEITDADDGFTYVNHAFETSTGYSRRRCSAGGRRTCSPAACSRPSSSRRCAASSGPAGAGTAPS